MSPTAPVRLRGAVVVTISLLIERGAYRSPYSSGPDTFLQMTDPFIRPLAADARVLVEMEGRPLERYAIMLQLRIEGRWQTIRLLDNAHGDHDMHRYTGANKQPAERFAEGTVNEVAPMAIRYLIDHWEAIAESWKN